ncbi:MAG: flavodoxin [Peptococcaceae bacterium]|nr:flavodoxin [Peptococcaceae bacterium]
MGRALVVYYSFGGVTRRQAQRLAAASGADLAEIVPEAPYTAADIDYRNRDCRSYVEWQQNILPSVQPLAKYPADYDTIYVGFPLWYGQAPLVVHSFLKHYNLAGKTVIPFVTTGGGGLANTDKALHSLNLAGVTWHPATIVTDYTEADFAKWIEA